MGDSVMEDFEDVVEDRLEVEGLVEGWLGGVGLPGLQALFVGCEQTGQDYEGLCPDLPPAVVS